MPSTFLFVCDSQLRFCREDVLLKEGAADVKEGKTIVSLCVAPHSLSQ